MTPEAAEASRSGSRVRTRDAWGVLFCGGASRRMGRDKATLLVDGTPLLERGARALARVTPRVLLASGASPRAPELGLECVLDSAPGVGPLAGLEAALARLEAAGVARALVLACDMPRVTAGVLDALLARAESSPAEVCLVATPRGLEPLLGVYHVRALAALRAARARGERRLDSFHRAVRVERVAEDSLAPGCSLNLNTLEDLERLQGASSAPGRGA